MTTPGGSATSSGAYVYIVPTSVTVSSSPDTSVTGQEVTFTATVTPDVTGLGAPTGTVTFDFGDGTVPVSVPLTDGTATTTHTYASASGSPYTVTAAYDGDFDFAPSSRSTFHAVGRAVTTTSLMSTPEPSAVGQAVTCVARVAADPPGAGSPTGTVTFDFGDGSAPVTAPVVNHLATVDHGFTATGGSPYAITATYNGDADFQPSESVVDVHAVSADISGTVTTLVSSPNPSSVGQSVTFTASVVPVPPAAGGPTGTVAFFFRDGTSATVPLGADGTATTTHAYATAGGSPFDVLALYSGDADFSSSSADTTQTVEPATTTTSVTVGSGSSVSGQPVTVTATVGVVAPGAGTPTGTVT
ncbi:Ig-like domain repeat protein, partial [Streptomyces anandii]|uniref:Ig-like domain repeat protein n=1 Tax=Streptomyces anandii TaxID=285454 RepID=UPI001E4DA986